jgi:hypothetical protein
MANNTGVWDGADVLRVVISLFALFIALGSASFAGEMDELKDAPVLESETTVTDSRSFQDNASSEDTIVDKRSHEGGVELDFSNLNFSEDSGMAPRKCGVLIPKIKY